MDAAAYTRRHLRFGWCALLAFLSLGVVLEGFHAFKASFYLDGAYATRRLLWTLAHAHGTLLALVNIAFAVTVSVLGEPSGRARQWASPCLMAGAVLLPAGFFLGGVIFYGGDPGVAVLLVPIAAALLVTGVALAAWDAITSTRPPG